MSKTFKNVSNINDIFGGGARFLFANSDVAKPTELSGIYNPDTGVLASGWNDFGATDGGLSVTRSYDSETWEVDQVLGAIDEFITSWNMTLTTSLAEASVENLSMAWEGGTLADSSTEQSLGIGSPETVTERMIAFLVDKRKVAGVGKVRAYVFYRTKYDGSDSEHAYNKGEKTLIPVSFKVLADTSVGTDANNMGIILDQKDT